MVQQSLGKHYSWAGGAAGSPQATKAAVLSSLLLPAVANSEARLESQEA